MSPSEIVIAVLGIVVGYWIVSSFIKTTPKPPPAPQQQPRGSSWPEVLGVAPTATPEEIRAAYQSLMSQYHPDKVATLGEELRQLAESKSKDISVAYAEAQRQRGGVDRSS